MQLYLHGLISDILTGTLMLYNMHPPCHIDALASAAACASQHQAGFGGILRLQGKVVAWFAFNITLEVASRCCFLGSRFDATSYWCLGTSCSICAVIVFESCFTWPSFSNFCEFFMRQHFRWSCSSQSILYISRFVSHPGLLFPVSTDPSTVLSDSAYSWCYEWRSWCTEPWFCSWFMFPSFTGYHTVEVVNHSRFHVIFFRGCEPPWNS